MGAIACTTLSSAVLTLSVAGASCRYQWLLGDVPAGSEWPPGLAVQCNIITQFKHHHNMQTRLSCAVRHDQRMRIGPLRNDVICTMNTPHSHLGMVVWGIEQCIADPSVLTCITRTFHIWQCTMGIIRSQCTRWLGCAVQHDCTRQLYLFP